MTRKQLLELTRLYLAEAWSAGYNTRERLGPVPLERLQRTAIELGEQDVNRLHRRLVAQSAVHRKNAL